MSDWKRSASRGLLAALLLMPGASMLAQEAASIRDSVREEVLDNGLRILMVQRPGAPMISAGWVAHVGSANERPGITGISHLFEHMMFKGSPTIGTEDNRLDEKIRGQLDELRDEMFALERDQRQRVRLGEAESMNDPSLDSEEMKELRARFDELLAEQRENIVKNEFDQIYTEQGATGMNAFTNQDMTVYFIRVPRNKMELWFWMESERLSEPVFREFYSERDVVYEERRMRTDSTPTGAQDEVFNAMFWRGHPYGWPVVGWPSDISAITRQQAEAYFDLYYAPNNLTLALVGDFDEKQAMDWAEEYLGRIPRGKQSPPDVVTLDMPLLGSFEYRAEVDAPPSAELVFPGGAFNGSDDPALEVLAQVLSGNTGRLYKRLVLQDQIATSAGASNSAQKYDGTFEVFASGTAEATPEQLRAVLLEEIEKIKTEGISEYELEKVQNQLTANMYRRLEDNFFLMVQLLYYDGLRDWTSMDTAFERIRDVTLADVQAAAVKYLDTASYGSKLYSRAGDAAPEDPALAGLNDQQKQMAQQMLSQMDQLPDDKLGEALAQLQGMAGQAPEDAQAVLAIVIERIEQRMAGQQAAADGENGNDQ